MEENFYKEIVENSQIGYAYHKIICDNEGVPCDYEFIEVNRAFEKLTGLKGSDLIGKSVSDVLPIIRNDRFDWIEFFGSVAINGGDKEFEHYCEPLNRWYKGRVYSPKKNYFITLFDDALMQRKALEEALSDEKYFEVIYDVNPDAILTIRLNDGIVININAAFAEELGYSRGELVGRNCNEAKILVNPINYNKITSELAEKQLFTSNEISFRRKDGSTFTGLVSGKAVAISAGLCGFYNIHNIEERKRAEDALAASESRYRRLFESVKDGIIIFDAESGVILDANPYLLGLLGYERKQLINKEIWEVRPFNKILEDRDEFMGLQEKDAIRYKNLSLQTLDKRLIAMEYSCNKYVVDEHKVVQCNFRDITDRKEAEESVKKRLAELETIYTISSTLRTAETTEGMLTLLLDEILRILDTTDGAVCTCQPSQGQFRFITARGWFYGLEDAFLKSAEGITGKILATKNTVVSKEFAKDSLMEPNKEMPEGWGGVCLPLKADEEVVGILFISVPIPREITSEELKLLTSLTDIAGTAMHRIGLFEKNLRQLEQLKALRNIDRAISSSMDLRVTFRVILDEINRLLNVDAAGILRLDIHTGILKYEAWRGFRITDPAKLRLYLGEGLAGRAVMERKSIRVVDLQEIVGDPAQGPLLEKENAHSYYAVPLINKGRIEGVLEVFHREPMDTDEEWLEFLETIAGLTAMAIDNAEMVHTMANTNFKLIQAYDKTIKGWAHALDLRDKETEEHSQRVTEMTVNIARAMGFSEEELAHVRRGSLLHDIGKMGIPDTILLKPGKLTEEEWVIMHKHPVQAFEMLSTIEYLRPALDIPYCHHEKWDGTGYPRGLKKQEIPLAARIFAVADVYDALTSDRPYRKAWTRDKAIEYIMNESGSHFDPKVVEMFYREVGR